MTEEKVTSKFAVSTDDPSLISWIGDAVIRGVASNTVEAGIGVGYSLTQAAALPSPIDGNGLANDLHGTISDDWIRGFGGADTLRGGLGADRMEGGFGNDTYYVDNVGDVVVEVLYGGVDTIRSSINYSLGAYQENLRLTSYGPGTRGTGNSLANTIVGNELDNVLLGRDGNDTLRGAEGNDKLIGEAGNDHLIGDKGNDTLKGGAGNDRLDGGEGVDTFSGGTGADRFVWDSVFDTGRATNLADIVLDFSAAQGDRLDFSKINANDLYDDRDYAFTFIGKAAFSAPGQIRYAVKDGETLIFLNTDLDPSFEAMIRLKGIKTPEASWFVL